MSKAGKVVSSKGQNISSEGGVVVSVKQSKSSLLQFLEGEVRRLTRDARDEVEARERIEKWIKESYKPTMDLVKQKLKEDIASLDARLQAEEGKSSGLAAWIKQFLGVKGELIGAMVDNKVEELNQSIRVHFKERDEEQWLLFNQKADDERATYKKSRDEEIEKQWTEFAKRFDEHKLDTTASFKDAQAEFKLAQRQFAESLAERFEAQLRQATQKTEEMSSLIKKVEAERTVLLRENTLIQDERQKIIDELSQIKLERTRLADEAVAMVHDIKHLRQQIGECQAERSRLQSQVTEVSKDQKLVFDSIMDDISKEKAAIQEARAAAEATVAAMKSQIDDEALIREERARLEADVERVNQEKIILQEKISALALQLTQEREEEEKRRKPTVQSGEVGAWLADYDLEGYSEILINNGFSRLQYAAMITAADLSRLGVELPGHRKALLSAVQDLRVAHPHAAEDEQKRLERITGIDEERKALEAVAAANVLVKKGQSDEASQRLSALEEDLKARRERRAQEARSEDEKRVKAARQRQDEERQAREAARQAYERDRVERQRVLAETGKRVDLEIQAATDREVVEIAEKYRHLEKTRADGLADMKHSQADSANQRRDHVNRDNERIASDDAREAAERRAKYEAMENEAEQRYKARREELEDTIAQQRAAEARAVEKARARIQRGYDEPEPASVAEPEPTPQTATESEHDTAASSASPHVAEPAENATSQSAPAPLSRPGPVVPLPTRQPDASASDSWGDDDDDSAAAPTPTPQQRARPLPQGRPAPGPARGQARGRGGRGRGRGGAQRAVPQRPVPPAAERAEPAQPAPTPQLSTEDKLAKSQAAARERAAKAAAAKEEAKKAATAAAQAEKATATPPARTSRGARGQVRGASRGAPARGRSSADASRGRSAARPAQTVQTPAPAPAATSTFGARGRGRGSTAPASATTRGRGAAPARGSAPRGAPSASRGAGAPSASRGAPSASRGGGPPGVQGTGRGAATGRGNAGSGRGAASRPPVRRKESLFDDDDRAALRGAAPASAPAKQPTTQAAGSKGAGKGVLFSDDEDDIFAARPKPAAKKPPTRSLLFSDDEDAGAEPAAPAAKPKPKPVAKKGKSGGDADLSDGTINDALAHVKQTPHSWMLIGYVDGSPTVMGVVGSGDGGVADLAAAVQTHSTEVLYGYVHVPYGDSSRPKFVFVTYVPEALSGHSKARANKHKPTVDAFLQYYHTHVQASQPSEVQEQAIMDKLKAAGGANYGGGSDFTGTKAKALSAYS